MCSSISSPRSRGQDRALTRLTGCSSAASISPAAKLAVISLVFLLGHLAPVSQPCALERSAVHLGVEHAQPPGQVEVEPDVLELGAVERRHVHGEPDLAPDQVIGEQPRGLDRQRTPGLPRSRRRGGA